MCLLLLLLLLLLLYIIIIIIIIINSRYLSTVIHFTASEQITAMSKQYQ